MRGFKKFNKNGKNGKKYISERDIVIIAVLVLINIFILGYGKVKDRNLSKELRQLQESTEVKSTAVNQNKEKDNKDMVLSKEVKNKGVVFPRNSNLEKALKEGKLRGLIFGDSIGQGISPETKDTFVSEELGNKVFQAINTLNKESLMPENYSVSGSTIENTLAYLGDNEGGKSKAFDYSYWILITGKNEMEAMSPEQFKVLYKMVVSLGEKNGIDVICCTEPPEVDMNNGSIIQDNYNAYKKVIEEVATEEGATFIDIHSGYLKKKESGEALSKLSTNGVIPSAEGYRYLCDLITEGIVGANVDFTKAQGSSDIKAVSIYNSVGQVAKTQIKNLTSKATTKEFNTGDKEVMSLNTGGDVTFKVPDGQVVGVIVSVISNTTGGTLNVKTKGGALNKTLKPQGSQVKEISYYISLENNQDIKNNKELNISPKGSINLSGLTFIIKQ